MVNKNVLKVSVFIALIAVIADSGFHYLINSISPFGYFAVKFLAGLAVSYVILSLRIPKDKRNKSIVIGIFAGVLFAFLLTQSFIQGIIGYGNYDLKFHLAHILAFFVGAWIILKKTKMGKGL